jgi:hypothetical protein
VAERISLNHAKSLASLMSLPTARARRVLDRE